MTYRPFNDIDSVARSAMSLLEKVKDISKKSIAGKEPKDEVDVKPQSVGSPLVAEKNEISPSAMHKKTKIVRAMKRNKDSFHKRYGKDAESVMHATATKMARNEGFELDMTKDELIEEIGPLEEISVVAELSKKTLGSYIKKASYKVGDHAYHANDSGSNFEKRGKSLNKAFKRIGGIKNAADKLAKEEVVAELSDKTLSSYANKAKSSAEKHDAAGAYGGNSEKNAHKAVQRRIGALKALSKIG